LPQPIERLGAGLLAKAGDAVQPISPEDGNGKAAGFTGGFLDGGARVGESRVLATRPLRQAEPLMGGADYCGCGACPPPGWPAPSRG
jgi:hypothetical protein